MVKDSGKFTLSFLETGQKKIATSYFKHVEPQGGKFGEFAYENGQNGCPIISDAPASVECDVVGFYELGDHSTVVGKVTEGHLKREAKVMMLSETGFNYGG
jgi:flavin reductase (DIM6/NTAB) family NADH-FMN oxidoreductase RutF